MRKSLNSMGFFLKNQNIVGAVGQNRSENLQIIGFGIPPALYTFTQATFNTGGTTGQNGPSLATARSALTGPEVATWSVNTSFYNNINGIQVWTVPQTGTYRMVVAGGKGGGNGGSGAIVRAAFDLIGGELLYILVGQTGISSSCGGGGGGGTYVARAVNAFGANQVPWAANAHMHPLLVGGGGGGQRDFGSDGPQNGSMGTFGTFPNGTQASSGGLGGPGGATQGAGGWSTDGGLGSTSINNRTSTGRSFINGGQGSANGYAPGNFGGGAGGTCNVCNTAAGAGPGGGYSGGGAPVSASACYVGGGGGGSFIHSTTVETPATSNGTWSAVSSPHSAYSGTVTNLSLFNTVGAGYVTITKL
jgi:hypothetical protein